MEENTLKENTLKPSLPIWCKPSHFKLGHLLLGHREREVMLVVLSHNRVLYKIINTPN